MKPNPRFLEQTGVFWSNVRLISQLNGYTDRKTGQVKNPSLADMKSALQKIGLHGNHLVDQYNVATSFGQMLSEYFQHRANVLNSFVEPRLMDAQRAKDLFESLHSQLSPTCPIPMNKQKGEKRAPAYFTSIINMIIESNSDGLPCDYDPRELTTVTRSGEPIQTLSRRLDRAFPSPMDPIAVWEVKEYYYTTTFGSRVADGVYETLLDGMELQDLWENQGIKVEHYLMLDAHYTWWVCGRSYLCRIIDMLHMGSVDEVLFGYEVMERLPTIVQNWVDRVRTGIAS